MINISLAQYLDETNLHKYPIELFTQYGDIIINSTGTGTLGRVGIFEQKDDIEHLPIIPDSHITTVRVFPNIVKKYMYLFLKAYQPLFESSGEGSTNQKELRPDVIKSFIVAIPPFNEQKCIVEKFEAADEIIGQLDAYTDNIKDTISSVKSKILDLAIRGKLVSQNPDDEPASVLLERISAQKEELIKQGKIKCNKKESVIFKGEDNSYYEKIGNQIENIDDEILFDLPNGWAWCRLGTIGEWGAGATPSRSNAEYYNGDIPWLKTGDLNDGYITYIPEKITDKALKETSVRLNPTGSVLIAMYGATIGKLGILTFPATTNQACCACFPHNGIEKEYLFYFLLSQRDCFINRGVGGAQSNISKEKIVSTLIPVPPQIEQKRISEILKSLNMLISNIEKSLS